MLNGKMGCRLLALLYGPAVRRRGRSIALDCGSRPRCNACITTFWQSRSPTSWRGSLGLYWRKVAATKRASSRERHRMTLLALTERNVQG